MLLSKSLSDKIYDYVFCLIRNGVRTRQYKSGAAIESGAKDIMDKDITLFKFIEHSFEAVKVGAGSIVFSTKLEHRKIYDKDSFDQKYPLHIKAPGHEKLYDMGTVSIRYSDDLIPEVMWSNSKFFHGHFARPGGTWLQFGAGTVCMNGYKDPSDAALSFGFSSGLLTTISFVKYSRYGSKIDGISEE
jgi:hypothetical protein